jgi:outer membrane protein OmpA-like peptidoglycan-associated protein
MKLLAWLFWLTLFAPYTLIAQLNKDIPVWSFDILFEFGKSDVKPENLPRLDTVARGMLKDTFYVMKMEAHTDAIGSEQANKILSQKRAMVIQSYLVQKGVDSTRIEYHWYGESQPVSDNETEGGRQRNRRVTINIVRRLPLITVKGIVEDDTGNVVPNAKIIARHKFHMDSTTTDSSGAYTLTIPQKQDVLLDIVAKHYFFETRQININPLDIKVPKLKLFRAIIGRKMKLNNLYFVGNQAVVLEKSLPELKNLLRFMLLNEDYKIEIQGHINYPGNPPVTIGSWHHDLSVNRAKAVYDFLIKNNIPEDRMIFKGYGNWQMIYRGTESEEYQALNRRVEIKILSKKSTN